MDLKAQIDPNTIMVWDLNTPLSPIDRSSRQKNPQRNFRTNPHIRPNGHFRHAQNISSNCHTIHTLFNSSWTFSKIDILGHKASLKKFKKIEITPLCKLVQPLQKLLKKLKLELPYDTVIPLLDIYPQEHKTGSGRDTCTLMFITAVLTIAKLWKQPRHLQLMNGSKNVVCVYVYMSMYI
jgi:hypothetical protein